MLLFQKTQAHLLIGITAVKISTFELHAPTLFETLSVRKLSKIPKVFVASPTFPICREEILIELKDIRETLVSCLHKVRTLEHESHKIPKITEKIHKLESLVIDKRYVDLLIENLS